VVSYSLDADGAEVIGHFVDLERLQDGLRRQGFVVPEWEHRWIASTSCRLDDPELLRACLRMLDVLEDLDDVRSVTSNLEADDVLMESLIG
jgi:transcriptional/translational regulatory protein YebC/TACO1